MFCCYVMLITINRICLALKDERRGSSAAFCGLLYFPSFVKIISYIYVSAIFLKLLEWNVVLLLWGICSPFN